MLTMTTTTTRPLLLSRVSLRPAARFLSAPASAPPPSSSSATHESAIVSANARAEETASLGPISDRAAINERVARIALKHGVTDAFPSLSLKFKIAAESIGECNAPVFGNRDLNAIKTLTDLVNTLAGEGASKKTLLEQSYDVFNTVDTVEARFSQMDKDGTRPANLYFSKR
ncbi:hypothetical protein BC830DRAFT_1168939 [Chytriomyces sp. MP71]|nr:hypothetical protein BC830DRAFT_1168939 [Chytriomyces sp. MP71]